MRRNQVVAAGTAIGLYLAVLLAGLATAPRSIASLLQREKYGVQVSRRLQLGGRLQSLVERLGALHAEGVALSARLGRIRAAYELTDPSAGSVVAPPREDLDGADAFEESIFGATVAHGLRLETGLTRELERIERHLASIAAFEGANPGRSRTTPSRNPLGGEEFVRTSGFGRRRSPYTQQLEQHAGLDLAAPRGTPLVAAAEGVVTYAAVVQADRRTDWWRLGRVVAIRHGSEFVTLYGHCEEILVRDGQRVRGGQRIATVGDSGWSVGPHLHYEIRRRGDGDRWLPVDPESYLLDRTSVPGEVEVERERPREPAAADPVPLLSTFLR